MCHLPGLYRLIVFCTLTCTIIDGFKRSFDCFKAPLYCYKTVDKPVTNHQSEYENVPSCGRKTWICTLCLACVSHMIFKYNCYKLPQTEDRSFGMTYISNHIRAYMHTYWNRVVYLSPSCRCLLCLVKSWGSYLVSKRRACLIHTTLWAWRGL